MRDLFTLQHASPLTTLRKLQLPARLPALFAGLRISAGLSVVGAIVGDFFFRRAARASASHGQYRSPPLYGETFGGVILSSLLGVVVFCSSDGSPRLVDRASGTTRPPMTALHRRPHTQHRREP